MNTHYICHDSKNFGIGNIFLPRKNIPRGNDTFTVTKVTFRGNVSDFGLTNRPCTLDVEKKTEKVRLQPATIEERLSGYSPGTGVCEDI